MEKLALLFAITLIGLSGAAQAFESPRAPEDNTWRAATEIKPGSTLTALQDMLIPAQSSALRLEGVMPEVFTVCYLQTFNRVAHDRRVRSGRMFGIKSVRLRDDSLVMVLSDGRADPIVAQIGCPLRTAHDRAPMVPLVRDVIDALADHFTAVIRTTPVEDVQKKLAHFAVEN